MNEIEAFRTACALAYSGAMTTREVAAQRGDRTDAEYADLWRRIYAPELAKVVQFSIEALAHTTGASRVAAVVYWRRTSIYADIGNMSVSNLLQSCQPLANALMPYADESDVGVDAYRASLQLIIDAFHEAS